MTDFNGLLAQYATTPATDPYPSKPDIEAKRAMDGIYPNPLGEGASTLDTKKASVATAAEQKKTAMGKPSILPSLDQSYQTAVGGLTGQGRNTMSEYERDIRTMGPNDLRFKYGNRQAAAMMGQANAANQEAILNSGASRTAGQAVGDTAVDIGSGFVMPALNIGAFGLGLVNQNAGVAAAQGLGKLNNWTQGLQSDELNQRRKLNEARNALDSRDSKAQQEIDLSNGDGELYAGLKRLGRGAVNAIGNAADDSAILGSGIANGVGSLLSGSVLAKGASLAATKALPLIGANTSKAAAAIESAAFPLTVGAMEGAGVYQQTADAIANTPIEQLANTSETFRGYIANGMTPEQARIQLANRAGITAGAITAPVAAAAGKLVAPFEANPFARASLKTVGQNAGKETLEESIQSGFGAFAQNLANKAVVNPNQSLLDNVGEQAGEGGLYGMGTTAAIAGPSALKNTVSDSSKYLWGKASTAMTESAANLEASNEAASPLAPNKVAAEVEATQAAMPQAAATIQAGIDTSSLNQEEKNQGQAYAQKLTGALSYGENDLADLIGHPLKPILSGSTGKADAIARLATLVREGGDQPSDVQVAASYLLHGYVADLTDAMENKPAFLDKLPADHPAVQSMASIQATLSKVTAQPMVKKILDQVTALAEAENAKAGANLTEQSMTTPEGQLAAQNAANAIAYDPAKANPALVNAVLAHATSGKLVLTPKQQKGIDVAKTLFDASREDFEERKRLGLKTQDVVSNQIQSAEYLGKGQLSALQHANEIYKAYQANNLKDAKDSLDDFRKFAKSIQNKMAALNEHLNSPKGRKSLRYQTIEQATRVWKTSDDAVGITPTNENSVKFMQDVAADAKMIAKIYNNLNNTFSELNGKRLQTVNVDARIDKPAAEVVAAFKASVQPTAEPKPKAEPKKKTKKVTAVPEAQMALDLAPTAEAVVDKKEEKVNTSPESVQEKAKTEQVTLEAMAAKRKEQAEARRLEQEAKLEAEIVAAKAKPIEKQEPKEAISALPINIYYGSNENAELSNLAARPFTFNARNYLSVEHAYQSNKGGVFDEVTFKKYTKAGVKIVGTKGTKTTDGYNLKLMKTLIKASFEQNPDAAKALLATGDAQLTHTQDKGVWAKEFPRILMEVRAALTTTPTVEPKKKAEPTATPTPAVAEPIAPTVTTSLVQEEPRTESGRTAAQLTKQADKVIEAIKLVKDTNEDDGDSLLDLRDKAEDLVDFLIEVAPKIKAELKALKAKLKNVHDIGGTEKFKDTTRSIAAKAYLIAKDLSKMGGFVDGYVEEETDPVEEDDSEVTPFVYTGKATGLRDVPEFATLFGGTANRFLDAYKLPADSNPISRISLADDALNTVARAVSSNSKLQAMMDSYPKPGFSNFAAKTYTQYVSEVGTATLTKLSENLQAWLAYAPKKGDNAGVSRLEQALASDFVNTWPNGKILNLLQNDNGNLSYDSKLVEIAVLAGLQWLITSESLSSKLKDKDVAAIFGITTDEVPTGKAAEMSIGQGETSAVTALANKIQEYWGLESNKDYPINQVSGITGSLAADILTAFKDMGILTIEPFSWEKPPAVVNGKLTRQIKTHNRVIINLAENLGDPDNFRALQSYPDAIEQAVMVKPEQTVYLEDERPDVARTQMRNPGAKNKKQALKAIEVNQDTAYKFTHQYKLYEALAAKGYDKLMQLFGFGVLTPDDKKNKFNKNHLVAVEGKNQSIVSAINGMNYLNEQVKARAEAVGKVPEEIEVHIAHAPSKVQRLQQIGRVTPQGDKNMRAVLSPHEAVLDLDDTRRKDYKSFLIAIAQAVGIRVHNKKPESVHKQIQELLNNELKPAIDVLQDWAKNMDRPIRDDAADIFLQSFKDARMDFSNLALQSLTEYALYKNAKRGKERTAFPVTLYGEADGMQNGPGGAMILHSTGPFTVHQLQMMRKVGYYPGQKDWTAQDQFAEDNVDTYGTVAQSTQTLIEGLKETYRVSDTDGPRNQVQHMLDLMELLFEGNLSYNDKNELVIKRGAAKSPVTVTIYGARQQGIASKIAGIIVDELYEKMSAVAAAKYADPNADAAVIMFGSQEKFDQFTNSWDALTNWYVGFNTNDSKFYLGNTKANVARINNVDHKFAINYTVDPLALQALTGNVKRLFVEPMDAAIRETMGESLMSSMELIRQATQVQSLFLEDAFQTEVKRALAKKEEEDPNFQKGDFLSENELKKILDKLKYMMPKIDNGSQEYYLAGSSSAELGDVKPFGMSLNEHFKTPAMVYGPKDLGVGGIAALNIGMVDGQMIMNFYWDGEVVGTLPVFDGINLPLDKLGEYSEKANKSIFDAWMGNAMKALSESFDVFRKDTDIAGQLRSPALFEKLAKALYGQRVNLEMVSNEKLIKDLAIIDFNLLSASLWVESRHRAMKRIGAGIDQMAGFSSPHWHEGDISVVGMTDEQIVETLNKLVEEEYQGVSKDLRKTEDISKDLENFGLHTLESGAMAFYQQNLPLLGSKMNIPNDQEWMFDELTKSEALKDWTFITGTKEQIIEEARKKGVLEEHLNNLEKGLMVQEQKLILLPTASSETLVHEMMHAATFSTVYAHYNGSLTGDVAESVGAAVERLEEMMNQFRNLSEELPVLSTETMQEYLHTRSVIDSQLSKVPIDGALAKASALNEFMAYTQSNQALIRLTKNTKVSSFLVQAAKAVLDFIKERIWGKRAPRVNSDMYSNVRFNTALLARYQPSVAATMAAASTAALPHSSPKTNLRLQAIRDNFLKRIPNHLKTPLTKDGVLTGKVTTKAIQVATEAAMTLNAHGFPMEPMEKSTFTSIVQTLATQAVIDPNTMARAQELFTLATKTLTVADFIDPSNTDAGSALYYANEQYNAVMGNYYEGKDALGRSTLLPVFMGLAMTNEKFRNVLSKLELPKTKLKEWNSLDSAFENAGNSLMDKLSLRLSGEGKHAPNVQAAIDSLTEHLMSTANDDLLTRMTEGFADWRETRLNKRNNRLLGYIDKSAKALHRASVSALKNPQYGKFSQTLGKLGELTSAIINEDNAEIVAQGIVSTINKVDGFRTLREVIADIVGRTDSNAEIYDQNKLVRTMVSQDRQHYRDDLPGVILEQFSRAVTKEEMTAMFHGLGKTDIALLRESMKDAEIRELFTKPSALPMAIRAVETQLKIADPQHWNQVEKKAKQLADYMNGKGYGNNLLRNAEAVSRLFMEKVSPKRVKPDEAYIKAVDKLVSLYAIDGLNDENRSNLSSLVQSETKGVDFVMAYLTGQRAEEMRKAKASTTARENYFKGFVPSSQDGNVTLVVSSDAEYSKLVGKSYTKVESYKGSSLVQGEPRSYYFANVPGRAAYNQGTMQNARQTAGGIDLATGFTDGLMTAGRITDRKLVYRLAQNLHNERATTEPLLPIYNNGVIVAFERAVDPKQLERLNQITDLAKMIGVWRGRQVEEAKVQVFNEALVDAAKKMYKTDLQNSSSKAAEYINVFDPKEQKKDPVLADAVRLLNPETIKYIEDVFGKDTFMVRKDMANDMLGYRNATVGDLWSGNHRWSPETENAVKNLAISVFGNKAYQYMVNGERILQNVVSSAKTLIVMKSIIVPISSLLGNAYQLISRGVPLLSIAKGMPRKTLEVDAYSKSRRREVKVEALLRAAEGDVINTRKLSAELQSIRDSYRRMSIWPLIEAGQFSSISDMEVANEDIQLTSGKLHEYIESLVDKLPVSIRNAGRYALVTKDTALFQGLQKAVNYGDFIAKAVLYDDLTQRRGLTSKEAMARITEEFVNYDRLPGRSRGYLESVGMLWFYNFKLRLVKIALSTIRNNPVHALVVGMMPKPDLFGSIGTPTTDNLFSKAWSGGLSNSIGPEMLISAPALLPTVNAVFD